MASLNSKKKSAFSNIRRLIRRWSTVLCAILLSLIPILFLLLFRSEDKSVFVFFRSNMGVSDWFGFWISYISMVVTALLTHNAYRLSKNIEDSQLLRQIENNKVNFRIFDVLSETDKKLKIVFPINIISIDDIELESAIIEFGNEEKIELNILEKKLLGYACTLMIPDEIGEDEERALMLWRQYASKRTKKYLNASLRMKFNYKEESITENALIDIEVFSIAKIVVELENGEEKYKIVDTGVSTKKIEGMKKYDNV